MTVHAASSHPIPEPNRGLEVTDQAWIMTLYPTLEHQDWWLEFRFLEDRTDAVRRAPVAVQFLRQPEDICRLLQTHRRLAAERAARLKADHLDTPWPAALFWGVQPRSTHRGGRKEHVAAMVVLAVDIDTKDWAELPEGDRPRAIWQHLHGHAPSPSIVTWTGHGLHAYWLLREPLLDKARGEDIQKAMAHALRGDHVQDCSRLLRWPHTVNYKQVLEGATPVVRVIWWHPEIRYGWTELAEHFRPFTDARHRAVERGERNTRLVWKRFHASMDRDSDLKALWEGGPTGLDTGDRSVLDMALAHALTRHRFDRSAFDTVAVLAPWNQQKRLNAAYLHRTWEKAHETAIQPEPGHEPPAVSEALAATPTQSPHQVASDAGTETMGLTAHDAMSGLLLPELPPSAWTDWARLYRNAVGLSTEAADVFHYVALLTVVGAVLGRSVTVLCGRPVHVNVYAMLIGPTGDRKSTAADLALALLSEVAPEVLLLNGVGSQEGLMERMAEADPASGRQRRTLLAIDEVAALLKKSRRESSGSLLEFITEVFHCPDFKTHATRSKGIHLEYPTLSILACSTPAWLEAALEEEDILGGFANRFVYVTGPPKPDTPLPPPPDQCALSHLTEWIRRVAQKPVRQLGWTPPAERLWSEFYLEWRRALNQLGDHASALLRRTDIYILKFACLAAAMDDAHHIALAHLGPAIDLGRYLAGCTLQLLGELGAPRDCRLERIVEQKLTAAQGQMRRKQLRQALGGRVSGEKLDRILSAMERNGIIRQIDDTHFRGTKIVQLT